MGEKPFVVVIDDTAVYRDGLKRVLQYDFTVATFSQEGINQVVELSHVDVFIVDYKMPRIRGPEVIEKLKPLYPNAVFIGLSTMMPGEEAMIKNAFNRAGADLVLVKDFRIAELIAEIKTALEGR